jgi:hypothetical protein
MLSARGLRGTGGITSERAGSHRTDFAALLKEAGYSTSHVGRRHLGSLPDFSPNKSGYDHFWGIRGRGVDYFTHGMGGRKALWDKLSLLIKRGIKLACFSQHPTGHGKVRVTRFRNALSILHYDGGSMKTYAEMVTRLDSRLVG